MKRKLNKDKKRYDELDILYKRLYESYAVGKISEEKFDMLSSGYETEQKDLKLAIEEAEKAIAEFEKDTVNIDSFLALAQKIHRLHRAYHADAERVCGKDTCSRACSC